MKIFVLLFSVLLLTSLDVSGQAPGRVPNSPHAGYERTGLPPVFSATKDQISMAQVRLKEWSLYAGESTGKYNKETQEAIKVFQRDNGLRPTGKLNRATVEMLKIPLTGPQRQSPVTADSFAKPDSKNKAAKVQSRVMPTTAEFEATEDQITLVQRMLKTNSLYDGKEDGKLNKDTREALKKFQESNGLEASGDLDRVTLEKMGIELTDKQKAASAVSATKEQD